MKVLVLNGSPKGEYSITLQTVKYLEKRFPDDEFEVLHVGQRIKALEKDFSPAAETLERAETLLFAYPVYTFIAPAQLHRFIELMKERGVTVAGKFAAQITTSKHFYDITAHRYVQDNCQELGMKTVRGLSADMEDLLSEKGRREAEDFWMYLRRCVREDSFEPFPEPLPLPAHRPATVPTRPEPTEGDVVIVTDCHREDAQLQGMIDRFRAVAGRKTRVVSLREYPFKGGCLGCFRCACTGKCVYTDGFDAFLRETIQTAEAIVYAFAVQDHAMSPVFKLYDDRQFCNGHRTVTMGMPVGYLISGSYSREFNLQTIVEARAQVGGNFLAGVATDERDPDGEIDRMAANLVYALENRYVPPQNFYGVGGMKIFRDLIWLMQGFMKADHRFYKAHGQYDFPQKKRGTMLKMQLVGLLVSSPKLMAKAGNAMNEGMIAPYKKLLEKTQPRG